MQDPVNVTSAGVLMGSGAGTFTTDYFASTLSGLSDWTAEPGNDSAVGGAAAPVGE